MTDNQCPFKLDTIKMIVEIKLEKIRNSVNQVMVDVDRTTFKETAQNALSRRNLTRSCKHSRNVYNTSFVFYADWKYRNCNECTELHVRLLVYINEKKTGFSGSAYLWLLMPKSTIYSYTIITIVLVTKVQYINGNG